MAVNKLHSLPGLAGKLVADKLLDPVKAKEASNTALKEKVPFISYIIDKGLLPSEKVAMVASNEFGIPLVDIDEFDIDVDTLKLLKPEVMQNHHAIPLFKRGKKLIIGVSDPTNIKALDEIKFVTGYSTDSVLVDEKKLAAAIERAIESMDDTLDDLGDDDELDELDNLDVTGSHEEVDDDDEVEDAPVVRFVNKVLLDAIKKGASDLHFEPYEKVYRVRFRVDGVLQEVAKPPMSLSNKIAARIKVMARLDVSERRVPQDGRIKLKLSKSKSIDFRVNTCPTLFGEKTCMRILNSDAAALQIDQLGYEDHQKEKFLIDLQKPYGMFLVTGPTGSGKTVSLYTGINILNQVDINISTAEDPVEINLAGVNQVQVDERTGMTFEKALKAFLRQDPDIILVGEIRDLNTASIAVKAAQTGHMVMSTLHTNDCPQTLTRLQDMGIQAFAVATTINIITAQRLCRRLNPNNKTTLNMPKEAMKKEGFTDEMIARIDELYEPGEDSTEENPGYKGRAGIYQVMGVSDAMKRLIIEGANAVQLGDQSAAEGIWDIRRSGLEKVISGVTSLSEVNRVTVE